jgi:transposase
MDETGWREANRRAWLWVAATTPVTVFLIRLSRGGGVVTEMLGETFQGIVGSDRWSAYNWLSPLLRQLCWAHLKRDFQAFVEGGGESQRIGEALLTQVDLVFRWWYQEREGTMSRTTFQERMAAVQQRVGELLRQGTACDHSKTAGTCRDILKREETRGPSSMLGVWNRPTTWPNGRPAPMCCGVTAASAPKARPEVVSPSA